MSPSLARALARPASPMRLAAALSVAVALTAPAFAQGLIVETLSWDEARAHLTPDAVVLVAVGAQAKEHGRHLPLNNDWLMAEYLRDRVVAAAHGPRRFYVLNTGVSTLAPLKASQALLRLEGIEMRFTDILNVAVEVEKRLSTQQGGTHADETETSMMLYIAPDVVRMSKAAKDYRRLRDQWPHLDAAGAAAATGVYGDPTLATRAKGEAIVEAMVAGILREIEDLRRAAPPQVP